MRDVMMPVIFGDLLAVLEVVRCTHLSMRSGPCTAMKGLGEVRADSDLVVWPGGDHKLSLWLEISSG